MAKVNSSKIRKELKDKDKILTCAREFGVVGDKTRLKICYLLCRHPELSVGEIAEALEISISTVSHSLARLKEVDLVKTRREAQTIYYSFKRAPFTRLVKTYLKTV